MPRGVFGRRPSPPNRWMAGASIDASRRAARRLSRYDGLHSDAAQAKEAATDGTARGPQSPHDRQRRPPARRARAEGTSFAEVLERSGAPRGSVYHHFPEGKDQLIGEALDAAGAVAIDLARSEGRRARRRGRGVVPAHLARGPGPLGPRCRLCGAGRDRRHRIARAARACRPDLPDVAFAARGAARAGRAGPRRRGILRGDADRVVRGGRRAQSGGAEPRAVRPGGGSADATGPGPREVPPSPARADPSARAPAPRRVRPCRGPSGPPRRSRAGYRRGRRSPSRPPVTRR